MGRLGLDLAMGLVHTEMFGAQQREHDLHWHGARDCSASRTGLGPETEPFNHRSGVRVPDGSPAKSLIKTSIFSEIYQNLGVTLKSNDVDAM